MLEIKNLYNTLESSIGCLTDYDSGYICDIFSEIADNQVDIYYSNLTKWAGEHFADISETIDEYGWDGCGKDLYKAVQMAQFRENEIEMEEELSKGLKNFALSYLEYGLKMQEVSEDCWETIQKFLSGLDTNDRLEEVAEFINDLFNEKK